MVVRGGAEPPTFPFQVWQLIRSGGITSVRMVARARLWSRLVAVVAVSPLRPSHLTPAQMPGPLAQASGKGSHVLTPRRAHLRAIERVRTLQNLTTSVSLGPGAAAEGAGQVTGGEGTA